MYRCTQKQFHLHRKVCAVGVPICLPLGTGPFSRVVQTMQIILRHNFVPGLLSLGAAVTLLHYSQLIRKRGHCHIPVLFGHSQTGKTTALQLALSLFGCNRKTFFSKGSKASYLKKCSESTFPVGCDDPISPKHVGQLVVDLFNGARVTMRSRVIY